MILVTGGAGFIGSNFIREWFAHGGGPLTNLDALTYAGNLASLADVSSRVDYRFDRGDIGDRAFCGSCLRTFNRALIVNFAAESHVDRSIHSGGEFIQTNVVGTFNLLEEVRTYWSTLPMTGAAHFVFSMFRRMRCMARSTLTIRRSRKRLRPEQPLLGVEGRVGPPGACHHLRTGCQY